jgi:hypothetical protein
MSKTKKLEEKTVSYQPPREGRSADRDQKEQSRHTSDRSHSDSTSSRDRTASSASDRRTETVSSKVVVPERLRYQSEMATYKKPTAFHNLSHKVNHQWEEPPRHGSHHPRRKETGTKERSSDRSERSDRSDRSTRDDQPRRHTSGDDRSSSRPKESRRQGRQRLGGVPRRRPLHN